MHTITITKLKVARVANNGFSKQKLVKGENQLEELRKQKLLAA